MKLSGFLQKRVPVKKLILFTSFAAATIFVSWMNFTEGHYQYFGCCNDCGYHTEKDVKSFEENNKCRLADCATGKIGIYYCKVLVLLSTIDLNK